MTRTPLALLLAALVPSSSAAQVVAGAAARAARPVVIPQLPQLSVPRAALHLAPSASPAYAAPAGLSPAAGLSAANAAPGAPLSGVPQAVAAESARAFSPAASVNANAGSSGLSATADAPPAFQPPANPVDGFEFARRAQELFAGRALQPGQSLGVAYPAESARPEGAIPGDDELNARVARSPLNNTERQRVMVELFKLGGATDADIVLQDAGRGSSNVIVTKKGKSDRVIVVGGHYDKVSNSGGVIDNWTGASMVANLYQAFNGAETDATIVFIAFAREEEGLIGSSRYVRSLSKQQRDKIDAMVNLDTLAVNGTFAWQGNSTQVLVDRIVQVARETNHPATAERLSGGDADSSTFRDAGIPAVTVFGATQDVIFDIIHSPNDNMAAFNLGHYKNAYLLIIEVLKSLDARPLGPDGRRRV